MTISLPGRSLVHRTADRGGQHSADPEPRSSRDRLVGEEERVLILARRVFPALVTLVLIGASYVAGFFFDPLLTLPLIVVAGVAVSTEIAIGYRHDVALREHLLATKREAIRGAQQAAARYEQTLRDVLAFAEGAVAVASLPALLSSHLATLAPLLDELVSTRSYARRRLLQTALEVGAVEAACDLAGMPDGVSARAVFYRREGGRFEPVRPCGDWPALPPAASRRSGRACSLRRSLAAGTVTPWSEDSHVSGVSGIHVPLRAGRRHFGVLWVERSGERLTTEEIDAIAVVAHILAAGLAAARLFAPAPSPRASDRRVPTPGPHLVSARGVRDIRVALSWKLAPIIPAEAQGALRRHLAPATPGP